MNVQSDYLMLYVLMNLQFFLTSPFTKDSEFVILPIFTMESENCWKKAKGSSAYFLTSRLVWSASRPEYISWSEFNSPSPLSNRL